MTLQELLKRPVRLVITNDVHKDVVDVASPIYTLINKAVELIQGANSLNFLIVVTSGPTLKTEAVITNRESSQLVDFLISEVAKPDSTTATPVSGLNLGTVLPPKFVVNRDTDTIQKAYDLLQSNVTDIVVAVDNEGNYVGKIKRNEFYETMKSLLG